MKKDIHPEYRDVVFRDAASGTLFLTRSTVQTSETVEYEENIAGFHSLGKLPRDFTLMVTVYMVGGGTMIPASGKDYLALQKVTIEDVTQDIVIDEVIDLVPVIGIF